MAINSLPGGSGLTAPNYLSQLIPLSMPPNFPWDSAHFPLSVALYDAPGIQRARGVVYDGTGAVMTAESLFNSKSTALTTPGATYWVDNVAGSDSSNGLTSGTAFATINKAVTSANTGGLPTKINIKGAGATNPNTTLNGVYPRAASAPGSSGTSPSVDIAFVCYNGVVTTGSFDNFPAPTKDATFTNCYSYSTSASNTDRVLDLLNLDADGNPVEFLNVATAAQCNTSVGQSTWNYTSTTLYLQRADGLAVTNANTRVLRGASYAGFYITAQVNVYVGDGGVAAFPPSYFDVYGSAQAGAYGGISWYVASPSSATINVLAVKDVVSRGAGGVVNVNGRAFAVDSYVGLAAFFNCRGDCAATDGFNQHSSNGTGSPLLLTVNCTGANNGRQQASCNAFTNHDNCIAIDVGGYGKKNRGGTCRSVSTGFTTKANYPYYWFAGTLVENDQGDTASETVGGYIPPTAFSVGGTATFYCDRTKIDMPANGVGYATEGVGASLYQRNTWPTASRVVRLGTVASY